MPSISESSRGSSRASGLTPSSLPLADCCIAASGTFRSGRSQASVLTLAERLGATTSKSVSSEVTHLITSQKDCDKISSKVIQASDRGIYLVDIDWLLVSESTGTKQPEADFSLTAGNHKAVPVADHATTGPKKRQASHSPPPDSKKPKLVDATGKEPTIGKSQIAKDWAVQIPIDEGCPLTGYGVHVDDDSIIWDASLNQANTGKNANKFYRLQLLVGPNNHCQTWTRWGRVGDRGQSKLLGSGSLADAKREFEKKFKDKSGLSWEDRMETPKANKYAFIERDYDSDSEDETTEETGPGESVRKPPPCTLDDSVQKLMQFIFDDRLFAATMLDMNYDNEKLPLGKLSKASIMRGFSTLKDLSAMIQSSGADPNSVAIESTSNLFYSLIPHAFGRRRPPVINNLALVKKEIELLEALADMKDAATIMKSEIDELNRVHPLDRQFLGLGLNEMTPLNPTSEEFQHLDMYLNSTRGQTHYVNYEIENIFRIERKGERERFEKSVFGRSPQDRRLLWHGSRVANFGGILSQGLRIAPPEAPVNGYMFGKGVYLADMSSKSANYCCHYISDDTALLLLCEAELGNPMHERTDFQYDAAEKAKEQGKWSTFGMGETGPSLWKDAGCLHASLKGVKMPSAKRAPPGPTGVEDTTLLYNEYICYDEDQVQLRYLFRVKMY
ncbi:hypothetical protein N0V93_006481 [Gnomoniopsis smithogilvyi]|uniref:Poly [ADP-ribose] polymerase n=1 Tax=Gnomoniopsis smithogilvyi TaxID=1191159 RepID=A0A9W8YPY0_9PEZI|nr:hypothetical protein N0V93_006481 [Gnomoniopsis smithogilvyi]